MKKSLIINMLLLAALFLVLVNCGKKDDDDNTFNLFSVEDDIAFGKGLQNEIASNPAEYPLLSESQYPEAYTHIRRIRDSVLTYGNLIYTNKFEWDVKIVQNDTVLNAFCAPGGYMYYYTGIIKFLDNEAQFAGVMAHEMAHADRRHSTDQLTKVYGIQILFSIILGTNPGMMAEIVAGLATGLASLAFSRDVEYEADHYSVKYLYNSSYDSRGVWYFFEKMGTSNQPEFLSTHPNPEHRKDSITGTWNSLGSKVGQLYESSYQNFKNSLP